MVFWIIAALALAFWIVGLPLKVTSGLIHIALAVAVILFIVGFFRGRRSATTVG
jgi:hypothetical protein